MKVVYAIGKLSSAKSQTNDDSFLDYLAKEEARAIYEKYGFIGASKQELALKAIP